MDNNSNKDKIKTEENILNKEKILNKNNIDIVIYHYPCVDGFASAYVVWNYYKNILKREQLPTFIKGTYGTVDTDLFDNIKGKNVLLCDFSYPLNIIYEMIERCRSFLLIDHHITAKVGLAFLDDKYKIFDMNFSGATLTYRYFHNDTPVPKLLRYVEDRDLWRNKMENNEEFVAWFYPKKFSFETYDKIAKNEEVITQGIKKGKILLSNNRKIIKSCMKDVNISFISLKNRDKEEYYLVGGVNFGYLKSEIGAEILKCFPYIDFSYVYSSKEKGTMFSLRSTDYAVDVSYISKTYLNGGGHRNASGCFIDSPVNCISNNTYVNLYKILNRIYIKNLELENTESTNNKKLSVAILNNYIDNFIIGKYLLQTRCIYNQTNIRNLDSVIAINSIYKNKLKINWNKSKKKERYLSQLLEYKNVNTIMIWSIVKNNIDLHLFFDNSLDENSKKEIFEKLLHCGDKYKNKEYIKLKIDISNMDIFI